MTEKEMRRKKENDAARLRRRKHRKKVVFIERVVLIVLAAAVIATGTVLTIRMMPDIKVARQLKAADQYREEKSYEDAIASCEQALSIDSGSVEAYRAMAGVYLEKEDREAAEQVLYRGWETTQDGNLLQEYCVYLLNDAVSDINNGTCSLGTFEKCILALEQDSEGEDVYRLLDACYERISSGDISIDCTQILEDGSCSFVRYISLLDRMIGVYEKTPSEDLGKEIAKYAAWKLPSFTLEVSHLQEYGDFLQRAMEAGGSEELTALYACVEKALWAQELFAPAFSIFESGDFTPIKEFMQSEDYLAVREAFIEETMEYWEGQTYIPVSREKVILTCAEGTYHFRFADFEECPETAGVINIWGTKQQDAGVPRVCISYEPASQNGTYFPHTIYEFVYLYSNVKIGGNFVPQMNYRFETRVETEEGTTSQLIGDWGGEHQWEMEY